MVWVKQKGRHHITGQYTRSHDPINSSASKGMRFWISLGGGNMTQVQMFEKFTKKVGTKLCSYRFFELQKYCPAPSPPHTLLSRVSTFFLDSKLFWGWGNRTASASSHPNEHAWVMTMVGSDTLCSKIWVLCFWVSTSNSSIMPKIMLEK